MKTRMKAAEEREMRIWPVCLSPLASRPLSVVRNQCRWRRPQALEPCHRSAICCCRLPPSQTSCPGRRHGQTTPNASIWQTKTGRREPGHGARSVKIRRSPRTFDGTSAPTATKNLLCGCWCTFFSTPPYLDHSRAGNTAGDKRNGFRYLPS